MNKATFPIILILFFFLIQLISAQSKFVISSSDILSKAKSQNPNLFLPKDEFETTDEYKLRKKNQEEFLKIVEQELINAEREKKKVAERLAVERAVELKRITQIEINESLEKITGYLKDIGKYNADAGVFENVKIGIGHRDSVISESIIEGYVRSSHGNKKMGRKGNIYYKAKVKSNIYDGWPITGSSKVVSQTIPGKRYELISETYDDMIGNYTKIEDNSATGIIRERIINRTDAIFNNNIRIPRSEARSLKNNYDSAKIGGFKQLNDDLTAYEYFNMVVIHPITGSRFPFGPTKDIAAAPITVSKKTMVPPDLAMRVAFVEPNGNGFLDAEEKGRVKVSITNSGQGSAMGVFVKLAAETSNGDITAGMSKVIGEIPAGQTKTAEFEINASKSVKRMENKFTVSATESYGFPPDPSQISFETFPFIPPKLELVDFGVSTPNEGNEIRPQTTTEVQARVQNRGLGPAEDVKFIINLPKGVYFTPDSRQEYSFSALKPGEFKDLEFSFNTAKTVGKTIDVAIGFTEESTTGKFPLDLDVEKPQQTIQQLVISGQEMGTVEFADVATVSVDIEKDVPMSGRNGKYDLAVVFGIESYKNVPGVSFAKRDAEWMKKYFENVMGIPKKQIYYKTDSDVGQAEFSKVFSEDGWLDKRVKEGKTNLYVYYAGHGAPDMKKNKAYLIPYDGDPNYASQTGYEMDALYEQLGNLGAASVTVFLDACFSGANRDNEMLLADARPVFMEVDESATRDVTVFSAAGGKEISSAWPEKKHGLFSYYLMKGMRGDADANSDKQITVGELGDYVKENVSDMAGMLDREQTPGLKTMDPGKILIKY